ncbi:hypothetical protein ABFS83_05G091600 [Erythranthe nasuta]
MDYKNASKHKNDGIVVEPRRKYGGLVEKLAAMYGGGGGEKQRQVTKLLVKVNIQNSLGPIHVVMSPENTVGDLTKAAIAVYVKEKRRPLLANSNPGCFQLHYSQFSLESLEEDDKLMDLGSRNFFLCPKLRNEVGIGLSSNLMS